VGYQESDPLLRRFPSVLGPKQIFVIISNVSFEAMVIFKSIYMLFPVFAIGHKVKKLCISITFQKRFDFSPLIPLKLPLPQEGDKRSLR
jgi:hypothetical protein